MSFATHHASGEVVFVYGRGNALITFWPLPNPLKKVAARIRAARKPEPSITHPE